MVTPTRYFFPLSHSMSFHHSTPVADRVPFLSKLAWGSGGALAIYFTWGVYALLQPVFTITLGMSATAFGLAAAIPRLVDAFTDPMVGVWSDNTRSRWGRRKPFITAGAILAAVIFTLFLVGIPEGMTNRHYAIYVTVGMLLFYLSTTLFLIPWGAMGMELTSDYHEKTRVQAYRAVFTMGFGLTVPWLFRITQLDLFESQMHGVRTLAVILGIIFLIVGLLPVLFTRENPKIEIASVPRVGLISSVKATFTNGPFVILAGIHVLVQTIMIIVSNLILFLSIYYVFGGDQNAGAQLRGWGGTIYFVSAVLYVPLITWLASKFGKTVVLGIGVTFFFIASVSKWFFYTPSAPYLTLLVEALLAPGLGTIQMINRAMLADVVDYDELQHGTRREGVYQSVFEWLEKVAGSAAVFLGGVVIDLTGFDPGLSAQSPETLMNMRVWFAVAPASIAVVAFILVLLYPLSERRMFEIKADLERRHAQRDGQASSESTPQPA